LSTLQSGQIATVQKPDRPIDLNGRRGMATQKATELRRLLAEVEAHQAELLSRQKTLDIQFAVRRGRTPVTPRA
jgi:hypothetical protein